MDIEWKYKIDVADAGVFEQIGKSRGISFPNDLKELILEANAATPSKYHFTAGASERVLGAVLSFNQDEQDTDTVFTALTAVEDQNLLPFAIDPFGNYICYDLQTCGVVFWDHESDAVSAANSSLREFLDALY